MITKIYKELSEEQKNKDVIFSSCLSISRFEMENDIKIQDFEDFANDLYNDGDGF